MSYEWYWLDARRKLELELDPRSHWAEVCVEGWCMRVEVSEQLLTDTHTHGFIVDELQNMFAAEHARLTRGLTE